MFNVMKNRTKLHLMQNIGIRFKHWTPWPKLYMFLSKREPWNRRFFVMSSSIQAYNNKVLYKKSKVFGTCNCNFAEATFICNFLQHQKSRWNHDHKLKHLFIINKICRHTIYHKHWKNHLRHVYALQNRQNIYAGAFEAFYIHDWSFISIILCNRQLICRCFCGWSTFTFEVPP